MLYTIMRHLRNFFATSEYYSGEVTIKDGVINPPLKNGQYYLIEGSLNNNGVIKAPDGLTDEKFYGVVTLLAPPPEFMKMVSKIEEYTANHKPSPFVSESFGGYSYTKAQGTNGPVSWKEVFKDDLKVWRRI